MLNKEGSEADADEEEEGSKVDSSSIVWDDEEQKVVFMPPLSSLKLPKLQSVIRKFLNQRYRESHLSFHIPANERQALFFRGVL